MAHPALLFQKQKIKFVNNEMMILVVEFDLRY